MTAGRAVHVQDAPLDPQRAMPGVVAEPSTKASFRPDIEGLRAVAILVVIAFHARIPGWSGGFIGVDVFFVVSGYLITGLLVAEVERTGRINLRRFYARRARRLLPASAATVLVTLLAGYLLLSPLERETMARAAFAAALYVSNIWFQIQTSDYFAADAGQNPFLHTWSLGVEEQFYLVWPIIIILAFKVFRSKRALAIVMLAVIVASLELGLWLVNVHQTPAFFSSPARACEFGFGGLAALIPSEFLAQFNARFNRSPRVLGALGLGSIIASAMLLDSNTVFPSAAALIPVIGTTVLLLPVAGPRGTGVRAFLRTAPMQWLGRLSYSWYLWHWPVLVFGTVLLPMATLLERLALAVGSLGVALASHTLIENPIRFNRYLIARPGLTLSLAAVVTLGTASVSRRERASAIAAEATPEQRAIAKAVKSFPARLYDSGCFLKYTDVHPPNCFFGDTTSDTTIVLFGDSHAAQWFSTYEAIANKHRWRLAVFTKSGCATPRVPVLFWGTGRKYPECSAWREEALRRIVALRPVLVIMQNSDSHVTWPDDDRGAGRLSVQQWRDGTRSTLATLSDAGIEAVVLHDTPGLRVDVTTCLSRAAARHIPLERCEGTRNVSVRKDVFQAVQAAAAGLPSTSTLDLSNSFCGATQCPMVINGIIVYRDGGHITDEFSLSMVPVIEAQILPLVTRTALIQARSRSLPQRTPSTAGS